MYTMTLGTSSTFYNPRLDGYRLENPRMSLEANKLGSLSFTIYPDHHLFTAIQALTTDIFVRADNANVARFRPVYSRETMRGGVMWQCEDFIAVLNDIKFRPQTIEATPKNFLSAVLRQYEQANPELRMYFRADRVDVENPDEIVTFENEDYIGYWDYLVKMLPERFGGYLRVVYSGSNWVYISLLQEDSLPLSNQKIVFGENLADKLFEKDADTTFSVIIPLGADVEQGDTSVPLTIASVNDGKDYLEDATAKSRYGRRELPVTWSDITDAQALKEAGQAYLESDAGHFVETTTFDAYDLRHTGANIQSFRFLTRVPVVSKRGGPEVTYPITRLDVPLGIPTATRVQAGRTKGTLTEITSDNKKELERVTGGGGIGGGDGGSLEDLEKQIAAESRRARSAESGLQNGINSVVEDVEGNRTAITQNSTQIELMASDINNHEARITVNSQNITAEVTRASDAEGRLSGRISVNADNITAEVTRASAAEGELAGRITITESSITAEVTRATEAEGNLAGRISITESDITAEVTRASDAETALASRITLTEDSITSEVTRATAAEGTLSSRITQNAESITAQANTIALKANTTYVDGEILDVNTRITTLERTFATSFTTGTLSAGTARLGNTSVTSLTVGGVGFAPAEKTIALGSATGTVYGPGSGNINLSHSHAITLEESGGSIVATIGAPQASEGSANFSIADTTTYINGVSAARTAGANSVTLSEGSWTSSGSKVITASNGKTVTISAPSISLSAGSWGSNHKCTVTASSADIPGGAALATLTVDASSQYSAGVTAGANGVTLTDAGWSNGHDVVSASNGQSVTVNLPTITLTGGSTWTSAHKTTVYAETAAVSGSPVATLTVDASSVYTEGYNGGWITGRSDGYNSGYTAGRSDGYDSGYSAGYSDGEGEALAGVYVSSGSWRNGSITIAANSAAGVQLDTSSIGLPSGTFSVTVDGPSGAHGTYVVSYTLGGSTRSTSGSWRS